MKRIPKIAYIVLASLTLFGCAAGGSNKVVLATHDSFVVSDELIAEIQKFAPSQLEISDRDGDGQMEVIIKHVYIERRMEPLNIHIDRMDKSNNTEGLEHAIKEYGNAIRELAQATSRAACARVSSPKACCKRSAPKATRSRMASGAE